MYYSLLADLILITHLLFILFVVLGGLICLRWNKLILLHIPAIIWGAIVELAGFYCPLTPLENYFQYMAGREAYTESFIEHYLLPIIYPAGLTREIQILMGIGVIIINFIFYSIIIFRKHLKI